MGGRRAPEVLEAQGPPTSPWRQSISAGPPGSCTPERSLSGTSSSSSRDGATQRAAINPGKLKQQHLCLLQPLHPARRGGRGWRRFLAWQAGSLERPCCHCPMPFLGKPSCGSLWVQGPVPRPACGGEAGTGPWGSERHPGSPCPAQAQSSVLESGPTTPSTKAQMCRPLPAAQGVGCSPAQGTLHFTQRAPWSPFLGQPGPPLPPQALIP